MGFKDLFSSDTDSAVPPENRLDEAIRELSRFYTADGVNKISIKPAPEPPDPLAQAAAALGGESADEEKPIEPTEDPALLQKIRSMILDTSNGGKHAVDIMDDESLLALPDIEKYIWIKLEQNYATTSKLNTTVLRDKNQGMMSQCAATSAPPPEESKTGEPGLYDVSIPEYGNNAKEPDAIASPHLSAIMINHPSIHPAQSRNIAGSIFFNSIPGIEMSQCSPFIKLNFKSDFEIASGMTLFGFANGNLSNSRATSLSNTNLDFDNFRIEPESQNPGEDLEGTLSGIGGPLGAALGLDDGDTVEIKNDQTYTSGIELFQSPQSLNTMGGTTNSARAGKEGNSWLSVSSPGKHSQLNPAAPIATLTSLNVAISGLGLAALANKTASLDFIIHDRSFMRFLAPLIGGSNFQGTSVSIEFGWMHPQATDMSEGNVYANFINSLRSKSDFNIQVANTSLGNDGQVKVSLKLASRGVSDLTTVPAGSGITHVPAITLSPLFSRITSQTMKTKSEELTGLDDSERMADIAQGYTALTSFRGPTDLIEIEKYKDLLSKIRSASGKDKESQVAVLEAAVAQINEILKEREDTDKNTKTKTLSKGLEQKRLRLEQIDIFSEGDGKLTPLTAQVAVQEEGEEGDAGSTATSESSDSNVGNKFPTIGSVITTYVGRPIQAIGKFDEVQLLFYPFNTQAGSMHSYNIASFTLDGFPEFITNLSMDTPTISCKSFIESLFSSKYAGGPSNPAHVNYGLSTYYKDLKVKLGEAEGSEAKKAVLSDLEGNKKDALKTIYSSTRKLPQFVPPDVSVSIETVPSSFKTSEKEIKETSILRIHIFDAKGGTKNSMNLLNQLNVSPITTSSSPSSDESTLPESAKISRGFADADVSGIDDIIDPSAIKEKALEDDEDGNKRTALFTELTMNELKSALKSVHPSITFGTQFTNVKSVSVSSNTGGAVNQVLLVNAIKESRKGGSSQGSSDLKDVFIIPASINMQTEGFPLIEYAQKYFIDFGTGTTMDNFYYVTGLSHSLTPGSFTTNIQFSYNGSATRRAIIAELERAVAIDSS